MIIFKYQKLNFMKTVLTLLFTTFALCSSYGQLSNSFDVVFGVDQSYRTINGDGVRGILNLAEVEEAKSNWRLGVNFRATLTNNTYLKFGARLSSLGYKVPDNSMKYRWNYFHEGLQYFDNIDPSQEILTFLVDHRFIELPISYGIAKSINKFSFYAEIGVSSNFYLHTRTEEISGSQSTLTSQVNPSVRHLHLSGIIAVGAAYEFCEHFSIFAQPSFRHHLTRLAQVGFVNEYLYSYGIEIGLRKFLVGTQN